MDHLSFPISDPSLTKDVESTHDLIRVDPMGQESLAYSIILPKGWISEELGEQVSGVGRLTKIGLFADRAAPEATVVQVFYSLMPIEVSLLDWVSYQAARTGTTLLHLQEIGYATGPGVDAGGTYGSGAQEHVVRLSAFADSGRIFLVSAMTPTARYREETGNIAIATNSFKLLHPTGSRQLEQLLETLGGRPAFHVAYPASWTSRPADKSLPGKCGVDLLLADGDHLAAYLRVKASDPSIAGEVSVPEALNLAEQELKEAAVRTSSPWIADTDLAIAQVPELTGAYTGTGALGGTSVELRFGLVKRGGLIFAATLISAMKTADPVLWMRSKRAYELALRTARPV